MTIFLELFLELNDPFAPINIGSVRIKGKEVVEFNKSVNFNVIDFPKAEELFILREPYKYILFDKYDKNKGIGRLYINDWEFLIRPSWLKKQYLLLANQDSWVYNQSTFVKIWWPLILLFVGSLIGAIISYFFNPC